MKILLICGSPRKGNTYSTLKFIQENFADIETKILKISEMDFYYCKGCYTCVKKGEEKCPVKDDRDLIERIEKGEKDKPALAMMIPFLIFKYVSKIDKKVMSADFEYYKDKKNYYYNARIPFFKKFIAHRVADRIIAGFD